MSGIRLIVGLGNPGREYQDTRHNAGFWLVDVIATREGGTFAQTAKFFGEMARPLIGGSPVWLLKPSTFMNRSGQSVATLAGFHRIAPEEILVAHDELDLLPGVARIKRGGGHAGHNGLRDIQARLGSADFWRLRLGIGHPRTLDLAQQVVDFVLHAPRRDERAAIDESIDRALTVVPNMIAGEFAAALKTLHTRPSV
jgi:PTH1 family peptidyl-tRNA hydrolase